MIFHLQSMLTNLVQFIFIYSVIRRMIVKYAVMDMLANLSFGRGTMLANIDMYIVTI